MLNPFFFFISNIIEAIVVWSIALSIILFEFVMTIPASIWKLNRLRKEGSSLRIREARKTVAQLKKTPRPLLLLSSPLTLFSLLRRFIKLRLRYLGYHSLGDPYSFVVEYFFRVLIYTRGDDAIRHKIWDGLTVPMMLVQRVATAVEIFPYRSMPHEPDYDADIRDLVPLNEALSFFSDYIFTTFLYYTGYFVAGMYIYNWQTALDFVVGDNKYHYSGFTSLIFELPILLLPRSDLFSSVGGPTKLRFFKRKWWRIGPWKRRMYYKDLLRRKAVLYFSVMISVYGDSPASDLKALSWYFWPKLDWLANPEIWSVELASGSFPLF